MNTLIAERKGGYLCQMDYVKLVMAFLVVACHTHPLYPLGTESLLFRFCRALADIAVPFFFLSSGYMLFSACRDMDDRAQSQYIKTYICRILRQYCLWSLIYLPISVFGYLSEGASLFGMAFSFVRNILLVGQNFCSWQLWYLLSTLWGSVFLLLLQKYMKKDIVTVLLAAAVFALSQAIDAIQAATFATGSIMGLVQKAISLTVYQGRILLGFVYLSLGKVLAGYSRYLTAAAAIPLTVVLFVVAVLTGSPWIHLLVHITFFATALVLPAGVNKGRARFARKLSTCIYFVHMLIVFGIYCLCGFAFHYGWLMFAATAVISCAVSVLLYQWGKKHSKVFNLLFG